MPIDIQTLERITTPKKRMRSVQSLYRIRRVSYGARNVPYRTIIVSFRAKIVWYRIRNLSYCPKRKKTACCVISVDPDQFKEHTFLRFTLRIGKCPTYYQLTGKYYPIQ